MPFLKEEEMTKIHTKLLVFLGVLVCSLCLCLGIVACSNVGEHKHTFGGFWLFDGEDGHYRFATCHPEVKSGLEPHVDKNGDFKCDVCNYVMHVHVDGNNDNVCDDCQSVIHRHEFEEEWSFNEYKHWHEATCEHFIERDDYNDHSFTEGVCECGIKESEVKVYDLYKNSPEYELYFNEWLEWLAENNVIEVEFTENGDGVYHYGDGHTEVRFIGERTVKVNAVSGGEPLEDVWFMVTLFTDNEYYQNNGTIALGIAKTDESGIAEIAFNPVGGYSSATIEYRIRIALSADIATELGIDEKDAKPIPNRYGLSDSETSFYLYEVDENSSSEDIAATVDFTFSKGWNAYDTIELPYKRFYQDLINGAGLTEKGTTYELTASGEDLFDYFIFEPAKYSFASSGSLEDSAKIEENAKQAASGIYKISFAVEGNANTTLYYWNENGVNMGAYHATKPDGTPSDDYITSISGGTAGEGKYTGGNYVEVTVSPANGLRQYQFGIISDAAVKVTVTVERTGDYVEIRFDGKIGVGAENSVFVTVAGNGAFTPITMDNVTEGLYTLTAVPDKSCTLKGVEILFADTNQTNRTSLWESTNANTGLFKGVIKISENAEVLNIQNNGSSNFVGVFTLQKYKIPELRTDTYTFVPATNSKGTKNATDYDFELPLASSMSSGNYYIDVMLCGASVCGSMFRVTVGVGDREYTISTKSYNTVVTYSTVIHVTESDNFICIKNNTLYCNSYMANVRLRYAPEVQENTETFVRISSSTNSTYPNENFFTFKATQSGTYKITLTAVEGNELRTVYVKDAKTDKSIIERVTASKVETVTGTFTLNEGDEIVLLLYKGVYNDIELNLKIEFVN